MILVVDDHPDVRVTVVRLLMLEGYEAQAVASGEEALRYLESRIPHCILLDHNMPGMTGLELLSAIRADPRFAAINVVMFSAQDGPVKTRALAAGANAFVLKGSLDW